MRSIATFLYWTSVVLLLCTPAVADDLSHVGIEELLEELQSREADIQRTTERIAELQNRRSIVKSEVASIKADIQLIEQRLITKTSLLYRLSRNGKAVKYLFSSHSSTAFLKRMQTLKKLVTSDMEQMRKAGLRLEEAQSSMADIQQQITGANTMLLELTSIRNELLQEKIKREMTTVAAN